MCSHSSQSCYRSYAGSAGIRIADIRETIASGRSIRNHRNEFTQQKGDSMNYQAFLIKYGEIAVKGKNRHIFEDTLLSQIQNALVRVEGEFM